ncbi:hypothetical protein BKA63DRAFT_490636 [Paraphoma chrysanthemicola]|nr:hypothetical protein BKA63DRAFT_490636 [Paraphoma chrysanthemicola]
MKANASGRSKRTTNIVCYLTVSCCYTRRKPGEASNKQEESSAPQPNFNETSQTPPLHRSSLSTHGTTPGQSPYINGSHRPGGFSPTGHLRRTSTSQPGLAHSVMRTVVSSAIASTEIYLLNQRMATWAASAFSSTIEPKKRRLCESDTLLRHHFHPSKLPRAENAINLDPEDEANNDVAKLSRAEYQQVSAMMRNKFSETPTPMLNIRTIDPGHTNRAVDRLNPASANAYFVAVRNMGPEKKGNGSRCRSNSHNGNRSKPTPGLVGQLGME